jgi:hypothetical protein
MRFDSAQAAKITAERDVNMTDVISKDQPKTRRLLNGPEHDRAPFQAWGLR